MKRNDHSDERNDNKRVCLVDSIQKNPSTMVTIILPNTLFVPTNNRSQSYMVRLLWFPGYMDWERTLWEI